VGDVSIEQAQHVASALTTKSCVGIHDDSRLLAQQCWQLAIEQVSASGEL
jgi:hypothetical protein